MTRLIVGVSLAAGLWVALLRPRTPQDMAVAVAIMAGVTATMTATDTEAGMATDTEVAATAGMVGGGLAWQLALGWGRLQPPHITTHPRFITRPRPSCMHSHRPTVRPRRAAVSRATQALTSARWIVRSRRVQAAIAQAIAVSGSAAGQADQWPMHPSRIACPASGTYEQMNVFGSPTGIRASVEHGQPFPPAPIGHGWAAVKADADDSRRLFASNRFASFSSSGAHGANGGDASGDGNQRS